MTTPQVPPGGYNCEQVWPLLFEFLDDGLDEARRERIEAHLRFCLHCRTAVELQQRVRELATSASVAVLSDDRRSRLLARFAEIDTLELPGTFPVPESEQERVKRLSKFSTRKREPAIVDNASITDDDAVEARRAMGFPGGEAILGAIPEAAVLSVAPSTNGVAGSVVSAQTPPISEAIEKVQHAKILKSRVMWLYASGIAAVLIMGILLAQFGPVAQPTRPQGGSLANAPYVTQILALNMTNYQKIPDSDVKTVERMLAKDPSASWHPILLPAFPTGVATYTGAQVWMAGSKPVACATLTINDSRMPGYHAAIMESPMKPNEAISGGEMLSALPVDDPNYNGMFKMASKGNRHVVMWTKTMDGQSLLYSLLVEGETTEKDMGEMALSTELEIEQRSREQSGAVPG